MRAGRPAVTPKPAANTRRDDMGWRSAIAALWLFCPGLALAQSVLVATYDAGLSSYGPGLVLQHILKANDPQTEAAIAVIQRLNADVLLLTGIDYDYDNKSLFALQDRLRTAGLDYSEALAFRPNTGISTGLDLDHDGAVGGPRDAQAYGRFAGQAGMAILSRLPIDRAHIVDFTPLLWRDLPAADLPPDMTAAAKAIQRLSTAGHYVVPITYFPEKTVNLLIWSATPPVFDGPEDRNGRRNADETALWLHLLAGNLPQIRPANGFFAPPAAPFILIGEPNLDPRDGQGNPQNLNALRTLATLQDPLPRGTSGRIDRHQAGDTALDTAVLPKSGIGLRLDMILPSADISVTEAGVMWPPDTDPFAATLTLASRHRPVWAMLTLP